MSSRMMSQSTKETKMKGVVAHQGERHVRNVEVVGSSPIDSTIFFIWFVTKNDVSIINCYVWIFR